MSLLSNLSWQHWAALTGGAVASGAVLFYLLRDGGDCDETPNDKQPTTSTRSISLSTTRLNEREKVEDTLKEILENQTETRSFLQKLSKEIIGGGYDFKTTYDRVVDVHPKDPLEKHGFTMRDFDDLLEKYSNDQEIRKLIQNVMSGTPQVKVTGITVDTLLKLHDLMLRELNTLVDQFLALPNKDSYEMKSVVIAIQALVGAEVEKQFKLTAEEVESAVFDHQPTLAKSREFTRINVAVSAKMGQLMGAQFAPDFS